MNLLPYFRHHPLVTITLSYITGITLSFYLTLPNQHFYLVLVLTGLAVVLTILLKSKYAQMAMLIFFFLAGHQNGCLNQAPPDSPHHIFAHVNNAKETIVLGTVHQVFGFNGKTSKFDVATSARRTVDTAFEPVHGIVRFTMEGRLPVTIIPGKAFAIRAKLNTPNKYATPGSFDYPKYLARQHIYVTSFIESPLYIQPIHLEQPLYHTFRFAPEVLRTSINTFIDSHLEGEHAAVYKALLTGDRSSISTNLFESFKNSGCLHILAISGIHMSLLGLVLYICFFWLLRRSTWLINRINTRKTAVCLCIVPLLFYTFIAGAKIPVVRSFIMSLVVIVAICYGKKHSFASMVSLAALLILVFSPVELSTPSFQLTFAAVISIAATFPILARINAAIRSTFNTSYLITVVTWITASLVISIAATLGTAPLLIYHFNLISLIGIIANLFVEPLLCLWSLVIGFIAVAFIFVSPSLSVFFFNLGGKGISLAIGTAHFLSSLPYSSLMLPSVSILQIVLYYLVLILLVRQHSLQIKFRVIVYTVFILTIASVIMPVKELTKGYEQESTISYLDVGHGSCTLIETPGGKRILIDGGALTSPGFDIGKRVIAPFLLKKKILIIDDVVITHPDSDHYNGIASIFAQFSVKNIWVNSKRKHEEGWQHLLDIATKHGTTINIPRSNEIIAQNDTMSIEVLANTNDLTTLSADNDNGLILKYVHGEFSAIFPGDISMHMEQKLVDAAIDMKATILLSAHHGSATSNSLQFLTAVQPEMMVVSSGRKRALFPAAVVTTRCSELGIPVITTNTAGTIAIRTQNKEYSVETYYSEKQGNNR